MCCCCGGVAATTCMGRDTCCFLGTRARFTPLLDTITWENDISMCINEEFKSCVDCNAVEYCVHITMSKYWVSSV